MKIYNTPLKEVQEIKLIDPPTVTVYTCGPTVYDYPHIGNWFTFIRYDLLIRALKLAGYDPKWVLNITDVGHLVSDGDEGEDKLEKRAKREGKTASEIADFYTEYFTTGLDRLGMLHPNFMPKATDYIPEQINLIKKLEEKGFTYTIDDGVYYDTSKFPDYAKFAQLDLDEQQNAERITPNPEKKNPRDFALWKFSPKNQKRDMEWDSPWGKGFPGWHIECSAMAMKFLGETIDVHAGGIDHLPVHHTNEIAQSEAATSKSFVHYWMHANHIMIEGQKIAKSEGNSITLEDIEKENFTPDDFRLLVLQSHYRTQSHFSYAILKDAAQSLRHLRSDFSWIFNSPFQLELPDETLKTFFENAKQSMTSALLNDLDSPGALSVLHETAAEFSAMRASSSQVSIVKDFNDFVKDALGISLLIELILTMEQKQLLKDRDIARKSGEYPKSDQLRNDLEAQGIGLRDTDAGTIWYPV